jgi:hypothetical protein
VNLPVEVADASCPADTAHPPTQAARHPGARLRVGNAARGPAKKMVSFTEQFSATGVIEIEA